MAPWRILILALALALTCGLQGKDVRPRPWTDRPTAVQFQRLGVSQGLSQSTVYATLQDRRGFLWFGTEDGLNRYDGHTFRTFRREDGNAHSLRANWITCLLEDRRGALLVGTMAGGLHRFDRALETFRRVPLNPESGERSEDITTLAEDEEGNLWVGTYGAGLAFLNPMQMQAPQPVPQMLLPMDTRADSLPGYDIRTLLPAGQGQMWLGFQDGGLALGRKDAQGHTFKAFPAPTDGTAPRDINALGLDAHGVLWIGCEQGLYSLLPGQSRFQRHPAQPSNPEGLGRDLVRRIYTDRSGALWVGTDGGGLHRMLPRARAEAPPRFRRYISDSRDAFSLSSNAVESIYEDRAGVLWVGCYVAGLNKLVLHGTGDSRDRSPLVKYLHSPSDPTSLSGNPVNAILVDRHGTLWVGTEAAGLNRALPRAPGTPLAFERIRARPGVAGALQDDVITCLYEDTQGQLWGGGFTGGLFRVDGSAPGQQVRFTHFRHQPGRRDSLPSNFVNAIRMDGRGTLWVGSQDGGLSRFDPRTGTFQAFSTRGQQLGTDTVDDIREDAYGTLWLATFNGLGRFRPDTGELRMYLPERRPDSLSAPNLFCLHIDRSGALWAGTNGGGLNRMVIPPWDGPEPRFQRFDTSAGLPTNVITALQEDAQGILWVSTSRALCRFDPKVGKGRAVGAQDAILGNEFLRAAAFKAASGELFFGGTRGFNVFHPEDITINATVPPVVLTDFQLFNQSVPIGKPVRDRQILDRSITESSELTLRPGDTVVTFTFAALHFVAPEHNRYMYRMEGLEDTWSALGNRNLLTFTTLPPGNYVLRVRGSNSDGLWNEEGVRLRIRVLPPWYLTWWFLGCSILSAFALLGSGLQWRVARLRRHNAELEDRVTHRTEALALANARLHETNRQKEKLTAMLVHDLRSPLTAIMGTLDILEEEQILDLRRLGHARLSTRHMITLLNDMLEVFRTREGTMPLDPEWVEPAQVLDALQDTFEPQCGRKDLRLVVVCPAGLPVFRADPMKVERALSNLLGNAIKFTPAGGTITLTAASGEGRMCFQVSDTGPGIDPSEIPTLFDPYRQISVKDANLGVGLGLAIVERIMDAHHGQVSVESTVGVGTTFTLAFPLGS